MRLGIQINDEFLDILPDTILQLQENNPFLQLSQNVLGNYSLPFGVPLTEKNMRLLQYTPKLQVKKQNVIIPASVIDTNTQQSSGAIKIDQINGDLNFPKNGSASLYYLFGMADFYQSIQFKRLGEAFYGNAEQYTQQNILDHVLDVMMNGNSDLWNYAFFPFANSANPPVPISGSFFWQTPDVPYPIHNYIISKAAGAGFGVFPGLNYFATDLGPVIPNRLTPLPYLAFVIKQIFAFANWTLIADVFDDPDFKKVVVMNGNFLSYNSSVSSEPIILNLKNHVPNVLMSSFLMGVANRFGWWYDFDYNTKNCTIRVLNDMITTPVRKDASQWVKSSYISKISPTPQIFSIVQSENDDPIDLTQMSFLGLLKNHSFLPAPGRAFSNCCYFIVSDNCFYLCTLNIETNAYEWNINGDNEFDYVPQNSSSTINTNCNIPESSKLDLTEDNAHAPAPTGRFIEVPLVSIDIKNSQPEEFYVCFAQGPVDSYNETVGMANFPVPLGCPYPYDLNGNKLNAWSLSFEFRDFAINKIASYLWSQISGPNAAVIGTPNNVTTTLTNLIAGAYVFQLEVTDSLGNVTTSQTTLTVRNDLGPANNLPVSYAGDNIVIRGPVQQVQLDGSASSDLGGTIISHQWQQISGPQMTLQDSNNAIAKFVPYQPLSFVSVNQYLSPGVYIFQLTVTDNDGATDTSIVKITITSGDDYTPQADAGADQKMTLPTNILFLEFFVATLNGSASQDPNGIDIGLVQKNWIKFLSALLQYETVTFTFFMNITDFKNLKWSDQLIINGTTYFISVMRTNIPISESFDADCIRIS